MAYTIRCADENDARLIANLVHQRVEDSRFCFARMSAFGADGGIHIERIGRRWFVAIRAIRLRRSKDYCGNHAGPCIFGAGKKHAHRRYLEGLDWVSWNDMINDLLDSVGHDGDVRSTSVIVRKGRRRRTVYCGTPGLEFDMDTADVDYVDYTFKSAPPSYCEEGTPGVYGYDMQSQLTFEETYG